jgi:hypothetical protein
LSSFGDMEVEVTGDQEKRTSPKSKMRIRQRGGRDMVCKRLGAEILRSSEYHGVILSVTVGISAVRAG